MNKDGRDQLEFMLNEISNIKDRIGEMHDDEREKYDNLPEGLQGFAKGEELEDGIEKLDTIYVALEEAQDALEELIG